MSNTIEVNFFAGHEFSYMTTKVELYFNETYLGSGSGSIVRVGKSHGLVTNWHVLSGKNPLTGKVISATGAIPNRVKFHVSLLISTDGVKGPGSTIYFRPIVVDIPEDRDTPLWRESRNGGHINDVVLLPLDGRIEELEEPGNSVIAIDCSDVVLLRTDRKDEQGKSFLAINDFGQYYPVVGRDIFILGYPKGIDTGSVFPIWKRGSIASEPQIPIDIGDRTYTNLILIDALTKEGMSGAPVICLARKGEEFFTDDGVKVVMPEDKSVFVGVYSGRNGVTEPEYEFSIGRVWKRKTVFDLFLPPKR